MFRRIASLILGMLFLGILAAGSLDAQVQSFSTIVEWTNGTLPHYACGAPGENSCFTGCANSIGISLETDPFTGYIVCDLPAPACTFLPLPPADPHDFTFVVMTDVHLLHGTNSGLTDLQHTLHALYIAQIGHNGWKWNQSNAGFPADTIALPLAVVSTGDETDDGLDTSLGAFRLLYEAGFSSDFVGLPLFPGYGNHEVQNSCEFDSCAQRMLAYSANAAACNANGVDPESKNYSWDWGKYHMVQLNSWAGDTLAGVNNSLTPNVIVTHGSGLPWLTLDLATHVGNSGRPVILFQHYGWDPFSMGAGGGQVWWYPDEQQELLNIVGTYNVVAIITGHDHKLGSYPIPFTDSQGNQKLFEDFVGGVGGQNGFGQFFAVRLTDQFLDLMPVGWADPTVNPGLTSPYPLNMGRSAPNVLDTRPPFYNDVQGCRKWVGPPLHAAALKLSQNAAGSATITNNTGSTIPGPFALQFSHLGTYDSIPALAGQVMFTANCAAGPLYILGTSTALAANASETILYTPLGNTAPDGVISIGGDYLMAAPSPVVISAGQSEPVHITTGYGAAVPFSYAADQPWLTMTGDSSQTPATLTLSIIASLVNQTQTTTVTIHSTNSAYADLTFAVSIAPIPVTFTATNLEQIVVDGVQSSTPATFKWQLNSTHQATAQTQTPSPGVQDRFLGWPLPGGTLAVTVTGPVTYNAMFQQFAQVEFSAVPSQGGSVAPNAASPDGYYAVGVPLTVTATANPGYVFSSFEGQPQGMNPVGITPAVSPIQVQAKFLQSGTYTVSNSLGASGSETIDGVTTQGPATVQWTINTQHSVSVPALVSSSAGTQYVFSQWSDGVTTPTRTITAGAVVNFTAQYQQQFLVSVTATPSYGGTVSGGGWYNANAPASLTATPASGFNFTGFSGTAASVQSPLAITVSQPENVFASFAPGTPSLSATAGAHTDTDASQVLLTIVFTNNGLGASELTTIKSITGTVQSGSGEISLLSALPVAFPVLPGQSQSFSFTMAWPSTAVRAAFTVTFGANSGTYTGKSTFYVLR